jgi:hypothetical protein
MLLFEMTHVKGISPIWGIGRRLWHNDFNVVSDGHSFRIFSRRMSALFIPHEENHEKIQ